MAGTTEKPSAPRELPHDLKTLAALSYAGNDGPATAFEDIAEAVTATQVGVPALIPPSEALRATGDQGITAWHNAVKVNALWVNSTAVNAWASISGIGWRRIVFANESAFLNITAMLSHARQMNASCNVRIEADNLIHEVYVW